jgi:FHS family Na+ dependent glucose MFS transporter 1
MMAPRAQTLQASRLKTNLAWSRLPTLLSDQSLQRTSGYYLLVIGLGLTTAVIGPTLPALAAQTGTQLGNMGLVFLASGAGFTVATGLAGRVFERVSGHLVIGIAQIAAAALTVLIPLAPRFALLLGILACKGLADGFISAGANTLLVWTHRDKVGPYMNAMHFCFGLGAFVAPFFVAQVVGAADGYRWVYWTLAPIGLLASLRILTLRGTPRPETQRSVAAGNLHMDLPIVISSALFLFFYAGAEIAFAGWIFTYAVGLRLASAAGAAYLTSAFWLAFTIGRLISIPLATRLTAKTTILASVGGCLGLLAFAIALPGSSLIMWILAVGLGFCMAPIWPTGYTLAGQSVNFTARLSGIVLLGDSFGAMVLPSLSGWVIEKAGAGALVYLVFGSLVCNLLVFGVMLRLLAGSLRQA